MAVVIVAERTLRDNIAIPLGLHAAKQPSHVNSQHKNKGQYMLLTKLVKNNSLEKPICPNPIFDSSGIWNP